MSQLPLQGVRVLEFASVIAGPYCSYMLTLLGADTVKIERPSTGDWMRRQGGDAALVAAGMGSAFLSCNAGKQSVALNLKDPRGVQIAREIASRVDVMIENWRPGTAHRLGVGFEAIRAVTSSTARSRASARMGPCPRVPPTTTSSRRCPGSCRSPERHRRRRAEPVRRLSTT
jgi:crotonobetainyl-CoA:carnitine CoA-transferase CaiB-like acyl-CoA transferase